MNNALVTTSNAFGQNAALNSIAQSGKSEITVMRYSNVIKRAFASGVNFGDKNSLIAFSESLPVPTRKQFNAAIKIVYDGIKLELSENATPENVATIQAMTYRLDALTTRLKMAVDKDALSGVRTHSWLSSNEIQSLKSQTQTGTNKGLRDGAALALLFGCGMRREEAANAKWSDIVKTGETFAINILGKGKKNRGVPLSYSVFSTLTSWKNATGAKNDDPIIVRVTRQDTPVLSNKITGKTIERIIERISNAAGVECECHDLRRTFAQTLRDNGVAIEVISRLLGHASVNTTMTYLNVETLTADVSSIVF